MQVDQGDQKHPAVDKEEKKSEPEDMEVDETGETLSSPMGLTWVSDIKVFIFISSFQTLEHGKQEKAENGKQEKTGEGKQEKKNDQPPQAKKPKVKTKTVDLPVQNNLHWQLPTDVLNMFVENEVMLKKH